MMNCLLWLFYLRGVNFLNNHTHKFTNPTEFLFLIIITISALTSANLQSIQRTKSSKPQTWGLNNLIHSIIHLAIVMNLHFTLCFFSSEMVTGNQVHSQQDLVLLTTSHRKDLLHYLLNKEIEKVRKLCYNLVWFLWPPVTGRFSFIISWTKR